MRPRVVVGCGLRAGGVAVAGGGAVVAVVASLPGRDSRVDPDGWLTWLAVGFAAAWIVWAIGVAVTERPRIRVWCGAVLGCGCVAGLVVVLRRMPDRGVDLSFPLTASGLALGALGAVGVVFGSLRWLSGDLSRRARLAVRAGSVAVAALLAAGVAIGVLPGWVADANTSATTARDAPSFLASTLDGAVVWQTRMDGLAHPVVGTAGGLAVLEPNGLRVLDPATGRQRWSFHRWDVAGLGFARRPGSYVLSDDGRSLVMRYRLDTPRRRYVDNRRTGPRAWVFDTVSGRLRADVALPDQAGEPLAVAGDRIVLHLPEWMDRPAGGALTAVGFDGRSRWRYPLGAGCGPGRASTVDRTVLVVVVCEDADELVRLDGGTGVLVWRWRSDKLGRLSLRSQPLMAVAGDTVVLDLRVTGSVESVVAHHLLGVRLADGTLAWQRPPQRYGRLSTPTMPGGNGSLRAAAGVVVFAEQHTSGQGRTARRVIAVRGFRADSGEPAWSVELPDSGLSVARDDPPIALLPDGRLVLAYRDLADQGGPGFCVVGAWDTASGQRRVQVRLRQTAPDAAGSRCGEASLVDIHNGVALLIPERGLLALR